MNFTKKFWVKPDKKVRLKQVDPAYNGPVTKEHAEKKVQANADALFEQQTLLFAENKRSVLIVLQGMDTAGKDGVIRHVMRGFNPQGCSVHSFKAPSADEKEHDYLWRIHQHTPPHGTIGIFNRSHYEDVLIARVKGLVPKHIWKDRYEEINMFEKTLANNGMTILKFFLYISKKEQRKRLEERVKDPLKNWKFNAEDVRERALWKEYRHAYETALSRCSTPWAPWFIIPSDKKWFRNLVVSEIVLDALRDLRLKWPRPSPELKRTKII